MELQKTFKGSIKYIFALIIIFTSCDKKTAETEPENKVDFRDKFVGTYTCLETFFYFDPINDTIMNWSTDTVSMNQVIEIEKNADSSLNVIIDNYSFIATYENNDKFTCLECNGPPDYVRFYQEDSTYVYRKYGVTNSRKYYGKKE